MTHAHGTVREQVCHGCNQTKKYETRFTQCNECRKVTPPAPLIDGLAPSETRTVVGNRMDIVLPKTRIQTLDELLKHCQVDLTEWEVERFIVNKWEVGAKNTASDLVVEPLFQVKVTLKKRTALVDARAEIEALKAAVVMPFTRPPKDLKRAHGWHSGNLLEINIPDLHVGKLAWGSETGWGNYDVKTAKALYEEVFTSLLQRCERFNFDRILFVVGNDLLNADNLKQETTRGTIVCSDVRFQKTFVTVREMMEQSIATLRELAPVQVLMVPGNHDVLSVWHLGDSLECRFREYNDVQIDNAPLPRKYVQHGKVMLMFTHGDKARRQDYPLLMATEKPEMFGQTSFREAHTGHLHQTKLEEQHGVRVRILPALCDADAWHSENGFVGNLRAAEAFIWNDKEGLIGTAIVGARELGEVAARA